MLATSPSIVARTPPATVPTIAADDPDPTTPHSNVGTFNKNAEQTDGQLSEVVLVGIHVLSDLLFL